MLSKNKDRNELYESFLALNIKSPITVNDLIRFGLTVMRKANINHHYFGTTDLKGTSQYLVFWGLGFPYTYDDKFYLESKLTEVEIIKIINLFEERIVERLPVAYITNEDWYNGYKFYVNENVLVPRSLMAKNFNEFIEKIKWQNYRVLDLCTGSGCIGITLALLNSKLNVDLVDILDKALEVTQKNIDIFKLHNRVKCFQSDVFENVKDKYDLIISNPPYLNTSEYEANDEEWKNEPKIALECGKEGLNVINRIFTNSHNYLTESGFLIMEVGYTAEKILKNKYSNFFDWIEFTDSQGKKMANSGVLRCKASQLIDFQVK